MTFELAPAQVVDWSRILDDVRRAGYTVSEVAYYTQIPKSTLLGYRNHGAEPRHSAGSKLLRFWAQATYADERQPPLRDPIPSAADFRR
ncbi:hypothetical protein SAMN04487926_12146 [Paraburkholderia steynii]|uniref:XRE family transcriptional regulator n=1 Tax=Paraburkholderia steynii TaxID=1245441 RepID=A0A7Z7FJS7_9BURK|nr:hypothetical protein [Paraburkholderia steynii]SDI65112.1 hypothetical protein SAMN04487926_12146 [Paraburkholderia steynii]